MSRFRGQKRRSFSTNTDKTMKKIFGLGLAALMLALPGCVQDLTNDEGIAGGGTESITVNVTIESPVNADGTRITLGGENGNAFVWEAGDKIVAIGSKDSKATYTLTEGVDDAIIGQRLDAGATLTFTGFKEGETLAWAYLLGQGYVNSAKANEFRLGSNQTSGNEQAGYNITAWTAVSLEELVGELIYVGKPDANGNLLLRNTMGIAEIKLKGDGKKIWGLTLASRKYSLRCNYGYIKVKAEEPKFSAYHAYNDSANNGWSGYALWSPASGKSYYLKQNETLSIYIAVPLQYGSSYSDMVHDAGDLAIIPRFDSAAAGGDIMPHIVSKKAHTFKRNVVQPFATIDLSELPASFKNATDLTATQGLSNCYMIAPSESDRNFCIDCQMLKDAAASGGSYVAFPLWETQSAMIKNICFNKVDKKIYFTVAGGKGNGSVVLGWGINNKKYNDVAKFWHIWVSDAKDISYGSPAVTMLDRNLGALWTPKTVDEVVAMTGEQAASSCGFYYQWGGVKPFPGPKNLDGSYQNENGYEITNSFDGNTQDIVNYRYTGQAQMFNNHAVSASSTVSTEYAFPKSMSHGTAATTFYSWASDLNDPRGGSDATWAYGKKGANDPCPAGYRIATHDELIKQFRYTISGNTDNYLKYHHYDVDNKRWISISKYEDGEKEAVIHAKEFGGYTESNEQFVWVPNAGYRLGNAGGPTSAKRDSSGGYAGRLVLAGYSAGGANKSNFALLWGVPKAGYEYKNADKHGAANAEYNVVSFMSTQSKDFGEGRYPIAPIVMMCHCGNMYEPIHTISLDSALPVRCVKLTSGVSVDPIEGTTTDTNEWN